MAILESGAHHDMLAARHPMMTLLSGANCVFSHCCRMVLLEKDVEHSVEYVNVGEVPPRLGELNPYAETPTLLDRDLVLYETRVIVEYLDERFPHPPLLPIDPVARAKTRLMIARLTRDWLFQVNQVQLEESKAKARSKPLSKAAAAAAEELRGEIRDGLLALTPLFSQKPFFLSDEYTLADAYFTPLLWRLPSLGVQLPKQAAPLSEYAERMFRRLTFFESLSPQEAELQ